MKKTISLFLALSLSLAFVACARQTDEIPREEPEQEETVIAPLADTEEEIKPDTYPSEKENPTMGTSCLHTSITYEKTATGVICTCAECHETVTYDVTPTEGLAFEPTSPTTCTLVGKGSWDGVGDLVVPAFSPDGLAVTAVGDKAFENNKTMTSCTLPPTVRTIGGMSFFYCTAMETLNLPAWLTVIGGGAFWDCRALKALIMPDTVTELGVQSVYECSSLSELHISSHITEIGAQTFDSICVKNLVIPDNITYIGDFAFCRCNGMETVVIPDTVTYLGHDTFSRSGTIKKITVGKGITELGAQAFDQNPALETVEIRGKITSLPYRCFAGDTSLSLVLPASVTQIGDGALEGVKTVTVENGNKAFVKTGDFLMTKTGKTVVGYYGAATDVVVPDGTVILSSYAFAGKPVTSVTFPESLTTVGDSCFAGCENLTELSFGKAVTYIGQDALSETDSLTGISVADKNRVYEIKNNCLCEKLSKTLLRAFSGATVPEDTTAIAAGAFYNVNDITELSLPLTLTQIGDGAFLRCEKLEKIRFAGTLKEFYKVRLGKDWYDEDNVDVLCTDGTFY